MSNPTSGCKSHFSRIGAGGVPSNSPTVLPSSVYLIISRNINLISIYLSMTFDDTAHSKGSAIEN